MRLAKVFDIDQDVIQIYNNQDIKLFDRDLFAIALKSD